MCALRTLRKLPSQLELKLELEKKGEMEKSGKVKGRRESTWTYIIKRNRYRCTLYSVHWMQDIAHTLYTVIHAVVHTQCSRWIVTETEREKERETVAWFKLEFGVLLGKKEKEKLCIDFPTGWSELLNYAPTHWIIDFFISRHTHTHTHM